MNGRKSTTRQSSLLWHTVKCMRWYEVTLTAVMAIAVVALVGMAAHLVWCNETGRLEQVDDVNYCGRLVAEDCLVNSGLLLDAGAPGTARASAFFRGDDAQLEEPQTEIEFPVNRDWADDIYQIECSVSVEELERLNSLSEMMAQSPMTARETVYLGVVGVTEVGNFHIWVETSLIAKVLGTAREKQVDTCALLAVGRPDKTLQSGLVKFERQAVANWQASGYNPSLALPVFVLGRLGLAWLGFAIWKSANLRRSEESLLGHLTTSATSHKVNPAP